MKKLFTLHFIILLVSCSRYPAKMEQVLKLAGENRSELEKVLSHYGKSPADSLKYKAAYFLIENMQWHYSKQVIPSDNLWNFFAAEDSLIKAIINDPDYWKNDLALSGYKYGAKKNLINNAIKESKIGNKFLSDLQMLNSVFLIETIETAFRVKELEWCKNLSFEDFCEYILSYRMNKEPVYPVRKKLNKCLIKLHFTDSLRQNPYNAVPWLNKYFYHFYWDWTEANPELPDLGFYNIFYWNHTNCSQQVAIMGQIMRSIGQPVAEVHTPKWRDSNLGHSWCFIPVPDNSQTLFSVVYQNPGETYVNHIPEMATKLYMSTFSAQPATPYFLKAAHEYLPASFNSPCIKDVTGQIIRSRNIEVELAGKQPTGNLCWFSIFIQGDWVPVGWGTINRETNCAVFEQIPVGLTGIACFFENGNAIPCSKLFTVTENDLNNIEPDETTSSIILTRKFPEKIRLQSFNKDIIGTKIQGANKSDFSDSITLYTISDTLRPYFQDIAFNNNNYFRYYRLLAPTWNLHIAELEFLADKKENGTVEASPLPIFEKKEFESIPAYKFVGNVVADDSDSTAFDGDMLSFSNMKWVGLDFRQPKKVNRIRIAPRNANNGIVSGNSYQLYYWDNGWHSAGTQRALYNFVQFDNVPTNTLYWLRNMNHGKEEQPFFILNGKQVFSNTII